VLVHGCAPLILGGVRRLDFVAYGALHEDEWLGAIDAALGCEWEINNARSPTRLAPRVGFRPGRALDDSNGDFVFSSVAMPVLS